MGKERKSDLVKQVIAAARNNNIGAVLFHQAIGQILGLNVTDVKCLDIIMLRNFASPSQLSELTGLSTGATTAMIDRLAMARLVERRPNPDDRRGIVVTLTNEAVGKLLRLFAPMVKSLELLTAKYSEEELRLISKYLGELAEFWRSEIDKLYNQGISGSERRAFARRPNKPLKSTH